MTSTNAGPTPPARRHGPPKGTQSGKRMSGEQRREQLLDIAEAAFGEIGYADTTMDLVALRAEVTKPVLYSHFGSKDKLLIAVLWRATNDLTAQLAALPASLPPDCSAEEAITAVVRTYTAFVLGRQQAFKAYQLDGAVLAETTYENDNLRDTFADVLVDVLRVSPALATVERDRLLVFTEAIVAVTERFVMRAMRTEESAEETAALSSALLWGGIQSQLATN